MQINFKTRNLVINDRGPDLYFGDRGTLLYNKLIPKGACPHLPSLPSPSLLPSLSIPRPFSSNLPSIDISLFSLFFPPLCSFSQSLISPLPSTLALPLIIPFPHDNPLPLNFAFMDFFFLYVSSALPSIRPCISFLSL